jgi:hypothetical protein
MSSKYFLFLLLSFTAFTKVKAQTSAIGNYLWYDTNRNGIQDPTEVGIGNVVVKLTKPSGAIESISTDANGKYLFNNLIAGTYALEFITPVGMLAATPNATADSLDSDPIAGIVSNIVLADNTIDTTIDAGFANSCTGTIRGNVFHDVDGMNDFNVDNITDTSGIPSSIRIPIGLKVSLIDLTTNKVVKTTLVSTNGTGTSTTNPLYGSGSFTFTNVPVGPYYIVLTKSFANIGDFPPNATLYNLWIYTGEKVGTGPGRDIFVNGKLNVNVGYECVFAKFGIKINDVLCVCDGMD